MQNESPYSSFADLARALGREPAPPDRPVVCVQGLGFVGSAMAAAVADARDTAGDPFFNVVGVELSTAEGLAKVEAINAGRLPVASTDAKLAQALAEARARGNLLATTDERAYELASVTVVDVPVDVGHLNGRPQASLGGLRTAVRTLGRYMASGSLVVVETTVPPGTTEKIVAPELANALAERGLPPDAVRLAHSYERVMPGEGYFDSVVNFWRCFAGHTPEAADACEAFLSKVINVGSYPLTRLHSTTASETAKVLENSYRATTIALMEEWGRFAEAVGVDLYEVIEAIRMRPTHSNIRQPGFGVGGYCIPKDPLFAEIAARELFAINMDFPFSTQAVALNRAMPLVSLGKLEALLGDGLAGRTIVLMGVSYRPGVGDTRYSPSEAFVRGAQGRGAAVIAHDPLVSTWPELEMSVHNELPSPVGVDAVVFAVPHPAYDGLDLREWLGAARPAVLDASNVLSSAQRSLLRELGCPVASIGRGSDL
jgi:UDP-N-acetyl-D-glucosamine dehydrogenase